MENLTQTRRSYSDTSLTKTDIRRIGHMLTYVFDREHFFEQSFTAIEIYIHMKPFVTD